MSAMAWASFVVTSVGAVLLGLAGLGKLINPSSTQSVLRHLRLPETTSIGRSVGILELTVGAIALVNTSMGRWLLLGCWLILTGVSMSLRVAGVADCGCFGRTHQQITTTHIVVNALVAASVAATIVLSGAESAPATVWFQQPLLPLGVAISAAAIATTLALHLYGRTAPQPHLSTQIATPHQWSTLTGITPNGRSRPITVNLETRGLLLLAFLTSTCADCLKFWQVFADLTVVADYQVLVVTKDPDDERSDRVDALAKDQPNQVVMSTAAWSRAGIHAAPAFIFLSQGQILNAGYASTWDDLTALVPSTPAPGPTRPTG